MNVKYICLIIIFQIFICCNLNQNITSNYSLSPTTETITLLGDTLISPVIKEGKSLDQFKSAQKIYFEIIDCFEYDNQQSCEDTNNTKSVCQWYDEDNNFGDINNNGIQDNNESNMPSQFLPICGPIKLPPLES